MQFQFSFKHMDSSDALRKYSEEKIREKVAKFVSKPIEALTTFSVDRHNHKVTCHLVAGDNFRTQVEATSDDMYNSVDRMIDKLEVQLKKQKEKLKDHKKSPKISDLSPEPLMVESEMDPDDVAVDAGDVIKLEQRRVNG